MSRPLLPLHYKEATKPRVTLYDPHQLDTDDTFMPLKDFYSRYALISELQRDSMGHRYRAFGELVRADRPQIVKLLVLGGVSSFLGVRRMVPRF